MGIRKPMFITTVSLAILGLGLFIARGKSSLNMDFVGGTVYTGELKEMLSIDEPRNLLDNEERHEGDSPWRTTPSRSPTRRAPGSWSTRKARGPTASAKSA